MEGGRDTGISLCVLMPTALRVGEEQQKYPVKHLALQVYIR